MAPDEFNLKPEENPADDAPSSPQVALREERLRALGEMASGIVHDLNNMLSPIIGFSEIMLHQPDTLEDKEQVRRYLRLINLAAHDGRMMVRRLRQFYRPRKEDEASELVDINRVVSDSVLLSEVRWRSTRSEGAPDIQVRTALQDIPMIHANPTELREALMNLIGNAVDAMPVGGAITLATSRERDEIVISVEDTGIGMSDDIRQRCLEPFVSTKGDQGSGLGLAMVYGIVQRHEGLLDIDTTVGKGTTFFIRLPIRKAKKIRSSIEMENSSPRLSLLAIDDDPGILAVIKEFCKTEGIDCETACNGREGLRKFFSGWFDVVISDFEMPEMAGNLIALAVKKAAADKPFILMTGLDSAQPSRNLPGVDMVLSKPITLEMFRSAMIGVGMGERVR